MKGGLVRDFVASKKLPNLIEALWVLNWLNYEEILHTLLRSFDLLWIKPRTNSQREGLWMLCAKASNRFDPMNIKISKQSQGSTSLPSFSICTRFSHRVMLAAGSQLERSRRRLTKVNCFIVHVLSNWINKAYKDTRREIWKKFARGWKRMYRAFGAEFRDGVCT